MLGNWIQMTSTTTGTGNLTLTAVTDYPTIADQFGNSVRFQYSIVDDADGTPSECGVGYVTSGTTLVREKIISTYVGSTYSAYPTAASLAGTSRIYVTNLSNGSGRSLLQMNTNASRYYHLLGYNMSTGDTKSISANRVYYIAGNVSVLSKVSGLACQVTTAAGTGSNKLRMGIYGVESDGTPGEVIAETSDALPNSTGVKNPGFSSSILLPSGSYYFGIISDVAPTLRAYSAGGFKGSEGGPLGANSFDVYNGFGTDNNGGSDFGSWTSMPTYVGLSFSSFAAEFPPQIAMVLA